jgi:hypothetical protein
MTARALLVTLAALSLASCRSPFSNVWEDPEWQGAPLRNVLVIGKEADAATRRAYEDAVVARLAGIGVKAEASHRTVPDDQISPDAIARVVAAGGQDGLIAARLVGVDERARYLPGASRSTSRSTVRSRQSWRSWDGFAEPGTWRIDRVARIETQVWSLGDESALIWAGMSESVNPRDIPREAAALANDTVTTLQSAGVLPSE